MQFFVCKVCITGTPSSLKKWGGGVWGGGFLVLVFVVFFLNKSFDYEYSIRCHSNSWGRVLRLGICRFLEPQLCNADGGCFEPCSEAS